MIFYRKNLSKLICELYYNGGKSTQRGALNAQALGRSNGTLLESYKSTTGVKPILISTKTIMRDAMANEDIVKKKAIEIANGELVMLKELVTKEEWDKVVGEADKKFAKSPIPSVGKINETELQLMILRLFIKTPGGVLSLDDIRKAGIPIDSRKRWSLTDLASKGYVVNSSQKRGIWKITKEGIDYITNHDS
jgi:hypothetical protein